MQPELLYPRRSRFAPNLFNRPYGKEQVLPNKNNQKLPICQGFYTGRKRFGESQVFILCSVLSLT